MILDAFKFEAGSVLQADVCIIGAGAAGLTLVKELASSGRRIVLLEAGGEKPEAASQEIYAGELERDYPHPPPHMYRHRRLGGSTTIWGGRCVPFDPIDFEVRDYVPMSGWAFGAEVIEPFYRRAQAYLDAGTYAYRADEALPPQLSEFVQGFHDPDIEDTIIERFSLPTNLYKKLKDEMAAFPNVKIVRNGACLKLSTREGRVVEEAQCVTPDGKAFSVEAGHYVVAAGGLESVRLLFNSNAEQEAGLGNHHDVLGRYYMCHIEASLGVLQLSPANRPIRFGFDRTVDGIYCRRKFILGEGAQRRMKVLNFSARLHHDGVMDPRHRDPILSSMFLAKRFLLPEYRRKFSVVEHDSSRRLDKTPGFMANHFANVVLGSPRLAKFTVDWVWRRYLQERKIPYVALHSARGTYPLDINGEQAPNPDSRILLGESRDRFDQRRLRVDWRMDELDKRSLSTTLRFMRDRWAQSGCGEIEFDDATLDDAVAESVPVGGHHIGGARMASSPRQGVVDSDLKVHGVDNLHIASAAVFPTCSHANPTLTLVALSVRLADRLKTTMSAAATAWVAETAVGGRV